MRSFGLKGMDLLLKRCLQAGPRRCMGVQAGPRRCMGVQAGPRRCMSVQAGPRRCMSVQAGPRRCMSVSCDHKIFRCVAHCTCAIRFSVNVTTLNTRRYQANTFFTSSAIYSFPKNEQPFRKKTIFGLSSGAGKAGVAVIRVSGPGCKNVIEVMAKTSLLKPRMAMYSKFYCSLTGEVLDKGILIWFPGPNSFTGEDVCEFHVHGGFAVIQSILRSLGSCKGLHPAEPGDFTKRAFLNNKLDLTEVEGLADLISAETEIQRRQALRQMEGELGQQYKRWRQQLLKIVAHIEAFIDFSEDENIEDNVLNQACDRIQELTEEIYYHLNDNRRGERLRRGVQVAIIGQPNVGKSSLLNILCQRPAAIVSEIPGTTRDIVESSVNLGGYPVTLSDTAGIRETQDVIEEEGVLRARKRAEDADLILLMLDVTTACKILKSSQSIESELFKYLKTNFKGVVPVQPSDFTQKHLMLILNKSDLGRMEELDKLCSAISKISPTMSSIVISCKTKSGIQELLQCLKDKLSILCGNPLVGNPSLTQERHRVLLTNCLQCIKQVDISGDLVICAEHLRLALRNLGKITGHVRTEEILDVVFKDFCIGK